jgi:hypothetical protein
VDKLTEMQTGADVVTETQLDLKAGHISGSVKKMSAASKYEVKLPIGVAGIRGTIYDFTAEGVIKVFSGSVVLAYTGANGSTLTQVVMGLQMFDARTGTLSPLPEPDRTGMGGLRSQLLQGMFMSQIVNVDYLSPGNRVSGRPPLAVIPLISAASINVSTPIPPPISPH